jgi:hypothetical protein
MVMPAMTANAANRLPLTPNRGRENFKYRPKPPIFTRNAMLPRPQFQKNNYPWRAVSFHPVNKTANVRGICRFLRHKNKKAGARPAFSNQ